MLEFRSIEEEQMIEIQKLQNAGCTRELNDFFDIAPSWAPVTLEKVKELINANLKKDRTTMFSIWEGDLFIGMGAWSSSWDPRGPWNYVIIWPEHRRKGHGTRAAEILLSRSFNESPAHAIDTGVAEWNEAGIGFLRSIGFKEAGRIRMSGILNGQYHDTIMFDMLKSEYLEKQKGEG